MNPTTDRLRDLLVKTRRRAGGIIPIAHRPRHLAPPEAPVRLGNVSVKMGTLASDEPITFDVPALHTDTHLVAGIAEHLAAEGIEEP